MEAEAKARNFPIVGRNVGVTLEVLARSIGARRVVELGSGYGYSGYWHARAVGPAASSTSRTATRRTNARRGLPGPGGPVDARHATTSATRSTSLNALDGEFDVVYDDIDKEGYPDAWRAARERVRVGGLYVCDNVLWYGAWSTAQPDERTQAILEHNAMIAEDDRYLSTIVPTRDGVMVASRIS